MRGLIKWQITSTAFALTYENICKGVESTLKSGSAA